MIEYPKVTTGRALQVIWQFASKYKKYLVIILLGNFIAIVAQLILPWVLRGVINAMSLNLSLDEVLQYFIYFVIALFTIELAHRTSGYFLASFEPRVMSDIQEAGLKNLLKHSYQFYSDNFTGSLVRKITRLSRAFERLADEFAFKFFPGTIIVLGSLFGLYFSNPVFALIFLVWIILFLGFNYLASLWKLKIDIERAKQDSLATGVASDILTNAIQVKVFTGEKYEQKNYSKVMATWRALFIKGWTMAEITYFVQGFLTAILQCGLLYTAINYWSKGLATVGDIVLVQGYMMTVFSRLWDIGRGIRNVYEGIADAKEMIEVMDLDPQVQDKPRATKIKISKGEIVFDEIDFNYNQTRKVFEKFSLKIEAGEKVAFVGTSGAGKTTITKLLMRFYDIDGGQIRIDGSDISSVTQESLRSQISYVPQEPVLFHRTIMDNIRYGRMDATDKEVYSAAKKAYCHEFIMSLPDGYSTYVGERGVKLSGGERQRVAIARAILKNSPILILDEATSSLDSESEMLIQKALSELMKNKTTIVIAHRLSTIMMMDRIVVVEEGRVVDQGKHEELIIKPGIYKKLWEIQAGGFIGGVDEEGGIKE